MKSDIAIAIGFALLGIWSLSSDATPWLGVALLVFAAGWMLTAFSPKASALLHGPVLRRK